MKGSNRRRRSGRRGARVGPGGGAFHGARYALEIAQHVERWLGPIEHVHCDRPLGRSPIDVLHVPPGAANDAHTFVTVGMSSRPMKAPREAADCRLAELLLCLPAGWPVGNALQGSPAHAWPLLELIELARLPHAAGRWMWHGHSAADLLPIPFHPSTELCAWLVVCPIRLPPELHVLDLASGERIWFFAALPLYCEELELKLDVGLDALVDRLRASRVTERLDPRRPNVALEPSIRRLQ